jgi:hypothetical protein
MTWIAKPTSPKQILLAGVEILDPVMKASGFSFAFEEEGKSSRGDFAWGRYLRGDRVLELHFRFSLGLVRYHIAEDTLDHESYMRLLGVYGRSEYPDFSSDPLNSFAGLSGDIQKYCGDFLNGAGNQFREFVATLKTNPNMFRGLPA